MPLARDGGEYRLDFDMVDKVINRSQWKSLSEHLEDFDADYEEITERLKDRVLFQVNAPQKLFHMEELLPSKINQGRKHRFKDDFDLSACIQAKVFGRKKPAKDGSSL